MFLWHFCTLFGKNCLYVLFVRLRTTHWRLWCVNCVHHFGARARCAWHLWQVLVITNFICHYSLFRQGEHSYRLDYHRLSVFFNLNKFKLGNQQLILDFICSAWQLSLSHIFQICRFSWRITHFSNFALAFLPICDYLTDGLRVIGNKLI